MGLMRERLFRHLIDECGEHRVKQISPYLMAEPLTDKRIFRFIDYIALKCPDTHIELSTTGQFLSQVNAEKLLDAPLSELRISSMGVREEDYSQLMAGIKFDQAMRNIENFLKAYHRRSRLPYTVYIVTLDGLLDEEGAKASRQYWKDRGVPIMSWEVTSRAGSVASRATPRHLETIVGCQSARNTHWMNILHDGRTILCCMDWRYEVVLGDAGSSSLKEIWEGRKYFEVRDMTTGLAPSPGDFLCKRCEWAIKPGVQLATRNRVTK